MQEYRLYASHEGSDPEELTFISPEGAEHLRKCGLLPNERLIKVFVAESYDEAMQQYYDFMKWGVYTPMKCV